MQDFLGDRCVFEGINESASAGISPALGNAYLYTFQLRQKTALLLITATGIQYHTTAVNNRQLHTMARGLARQLRAKMPDYLGNAQGLYNQLISLFDTILSAQQITSLVIIPDGVLRLVPFGVLHDGEQFLIENQSIATTTGFATADFAQWPTMLPFLLFVAAFAGGGPDRAVGAVLPQPPAVTMMATAAANGRQWG